MSNYHYDDQSNCSSCISKNSYLNLEDTTKYNCDLPCLCRFENERSSKDQMYYNWFVLNQPMNLPKDNNNIPKPKNNMCDNNKK